MASSKSAMVVLSGGQDSTTSLYWAIQKFGRENIAAITFDYGQRHRIEIDAATKIARMAGIRHTIVNVEGTLLSTSPLTSSTDLEQYPNHDHMEKVIGNRVELTFVPMRNTLFFTVALNHALAAGCRTLVTGICQEDNANYPDCRDTFRQVFERMANLSLGLDYDNVEERVSIEAPLMYYSKAATVRMAYALGDECLRALSFSHTSYDGKYPPTDKNHANVLRAHGFEMAGFPDPLVVRAYLEQAMELPDTANYPDSNVRVVSGIVVQVSFIFPVVKAGKSPNA